MVGNVVRLVFHLFARIANGNGKAAIPHDGQIDDIVTDVSDFVGSQVFFLQNLAEYRELVRNALINMVQFEVTRAQSDCLGDTLGDDACFQAAQPGERNAGAIVRIESLGFYDGFAVNGIATVVSPRGDMIGSAASAFAGGRNRKMVPSVITPSTSNRMSLIFSARSLDIRKD